MQLRDDGGKRAGHQNYLNRPRTLNSNGNVSHFILAERADDIATIEDLDALETRLSEEVEGNEAIIYTGRTWIYCLGSNK